MKTINDKVWNRQLGLWDFWKSASQKSASWFRGNGRASVWRWLRDPQTSPEKSLNEQQLEGNKWEARQSSGRKTESELTFQNRRQERLTVHRSLSDISRGRGKTSTEVMDTSKPSGLTFSSAPQLPQGPPAPRRSADGVSTEPLFCVYMSAALIAVLNDSDPTELRPRWQALLLLHRFCCSLIVTIVSEAPRGHCTFPPQTSLHLLSLQVFWCTLSPNPSRTPLISLFRWGLAGTFLHLNMFLYIICVCIYLVLLQTINPSDLICKESNHSK